MNFLTLHDRHNIRTRYRKNTIYANIKLISTPEKHTTKARQVLVFLPVSNASTNKFYIFGQSSYVCIYSRSSVQISTKSCNGVYLLFLVIYTMPLAYLQYRLSHQRWIVMLATLDWSSLLLIPLMLPQPIQVIPQVGLLKMALHA